MTLASTASIAVIGTGAVGRAFSHGILACGRGLTCVHSPSGSTSLAEQLRVPSGTLAQASQANVVLLCVPDAAVATVCTALDVGPNQLIAHASGALDITPLASAKQAGATVGSLHPVMVLTRTGRGHLALQGATAAIDGDDDAATWLAAFAEDLGMRTVAIDPAQRGLYHLSAAVIGGLMTGLLAESADLWTHLGYDAQTGAKALAPMVQEAGRNLGALDEGDVVMGPAARGDYETIATHIAALHEHAPHLLGLYRELVRSCLRKVTLPSDVQQRVEASLEHAPAVD
jgi:predicted short-subunit dehydrogenase-like oxidoreductase (DUF2520 family)